MLGKMRWAAAAFGLTAIAYAGATYVDTTTFLRRARPSEGVVTKVEERESRDGDGGSTRCDTPIVTFTTAGTRSMDLRGSGHVLSWCSAYWVGEEISVLYDPANPSDSRFASPRELWSGVFLFAIWGVASLAGAVACAVAERQTGRRDSQRRPRRLARLTRLLEPDERITWIGYPDAPAYVRERAHSTSSEIILGACWLLVPGALLGASLVQAPPTALTLVLVAVAGVAALPSLHVVFHPLRARADAMATVYALTTKRALCLNVRHRPEVTSLSLPTLHRLDIRRSKDGRGGTVAWLRDGTNDDGLPGRQLSFSALPDLGQILESLLGRDDPP